MHRRQARIRLVRKESSNRCIDGKQGFASSARSPQIQRRQHRASFVYLLPRHAHPLHPAPPARYHPVFALSMSELGRCTNAEATFPLPPDTRPIDRAPYRANPRAKAVIDECVHDMLEWDIIEEHPSPWGSPCTLVAKKNGSPRFCVDYRHTLNGHIVRKSCCLLYTSPSPRDKRQSRMPSSA